MFHYMNENKVFKEIYANDLDKSMICFYKAIQEGRLNELLQKYGYNFIDRDTFLKLAKRNDEITALMTMIWSFGSKSAFFHHSYLYGADKECQNELIYRLLVEGTDKNLSEYYKAHYKPYEKEIKEIYKNGVPSKVRIENHARIKRVKNINVKGVQFYNLDCIEFLNSLPEETLKNAIVYIDPPYKRTQRYKEGEEDLTSKISKWAQEHKNICPVYVSEYSDIEGLNKVITFKKRSILNSKNKGGVKDENLYYNGYIEKEY